MICCVNKLSIWPISKQMENPLKTVAQSHQRDLKTFANSTNLNRVSNSMFCKLLLCYWLFCCFFETVLFKTFEFLPFRRNLCPCMAWPSGLGAWLEIGWSGVQFPLNPPTRFVLGCPSSTPQLHLYNSQLVCFLLVGTLDLLFISALCFSFGPNGAPSRVLKYTGLLVCLLLGDFEYVYWKQ